MAVFAPIAKASEKTMMHVTLGFFASMRMA
jgi:hypothetical protein